MSGYLEGSDAFDTVLDRLIDAEHRVMTMQKESNEHSAALFSARQELDRMRRVHADLEARSRRDSPKLNALWQAADALVTRLRAGKSAGDLVDKLRETLAAASDACDQIPF